MTTTICTASFLSTLSLRRATKLCDLLLTIIGHFYPRSPCGERPADKHAQQPRQPISIHALLAESDPGKVKLVEPGLVFLSTLSLRRATVRKRQVITVIENFYPRSPCGERQSASYNANLEESISIHALLAESDRLAPCSRDNSMDFYPRSPCGERPTTIITICIVPRFLSTLSLRRATPRQPETHQ